VELSGFGSNGLYVNPQTMRDGDEVLVADALRRALAADSARAPEPALAAAR
jgi:hypothetical protein